jgi:polyphosphate kinase
MTVTDQTKELIFNSKLISRDLSWLKFNHRVLDQARHMDRTLLERLKFMAITGSNLDEFFMIRVGSLYNYIDYGKQRVDYSGLRERPFKKLLYHYTHEFTDEQRSLYRDQLAPEYDKNGILIAGVEDLNDEEKKMVKAYFKKTVFPMLTPMVYDNYHPFPLLMNLLQIFAVITKAKSKAVKRKLSFIQIPQNLPKFFEIERENVMVFVPISEVIKAHINKLFRNIEIDSLSLFRLTRNGDFTLEESDDIDANFLEELKQKLKTRKTGRVVRIEIQDGFDSWLKSVLMNRWDLSEEDIFEKPYGDLMDYTALWQIVNHDEFKASQPKPLKQSMPLLYPDDGDDDIFEVLKSRDILMHHPYNNMDLLIDLLEKSAEDPGVLSIKLTVYRLAKNSRVVSALLRAAEKGKHVSVLFEVKARFDEENNIHAAQKLQRAGCFVIYGISNVKTHTKLLLIVRKEGNSVTRYLHMSSGNYNEVTANLYTDIGLLTSDETYGKDVSEFFNAITGHSLPNIYEYLITAPKDMRQQLIEKIRVETENASQGKKSGIVIKINSLQDKHVIRELYKASSAGVPVKLIVRGICSLRPQRKDLSDNIEVYSIVGDYLEHSRLYYFHNDGDPKVYGGSADVMVRSFDRRIESLFLIKDKKVRAQAINILKFNLMDNVNSYVMNEDGSYSVKSVDGQEPFNIHKAFYSLKPEDLCDNCLID